MDTTTTSSSNLTRTPDPGLTPAVVGTSGSSSGTIRTPLHHNERIRSRCPTSATSTATSATASTAVTPASAFSAARHEPLDRNTVLAIVEGRGQARGEIGIVCMNLQTPNIILCQLSDTQCYAKVIAKVNIFRPMEIIMPSTSCDPSSQSQLCERLKKELPTVNIVSVQRRIFNDAKGLQKLTSLVADQYNSVLHSITSKYYALSACSALLKYVELIQSMIFAPHSLRLEFQGCDQTCMIDYVTTQHLELLVNNQNPKCGHSLFGVLNDCKTPLGARLLRMSILQPSCDVELINERLNSVEELIKEREMLYGIQDILSRLPIDIEHVVASLIQIPKTISVKTTEQRINYIIALKHTLELVPNLANLLETSADRRLQTMRAELIAPQFEVMLTKIKKIINEEAQFQRGAINMKRQRCFAVKADVNPILDIARNAYCEIIEDMNKYVTELSRHENLSLRLITSAQRGFYIQFISRSVQMPRMNPDFLQVRKRGNYVSFTTEVLISSDHRAQEILKEIENLSGIVISELITLLRDDISSLFKVCDAIGYLDVIYSLTNYTLITPRCVRPTFSKNVTSVTMGRHPILETIAEDPAVPNNISLSEYVNFMLITGPNMSGKTTYIKQYALLQILAQVGCFVPAEAATFRIASNVLSRIGTGDCIQENASTFGLELEEITYILQNVDKNSLVIIDELGRATSVEEGSAVSWAIAEELLKTDAFVLFATHHLFLAKLESVYFNAMNYTMEACEWQKNEEEGGRNSRLHYSHVMKRGVTDVANYGLKLAMSTSFPKDVLSRAKELLKTIQESRGIQNSPKNVSEVQKKRDDYLLGSHLCILADTLDIDNVDPAVLKEYLQGLQREFNLKSDPI